MGAIAQSFPGLFTFTDLWHMPVTEFHLWLRLAKASRLEGLLYDADVLIAAMSTLSKGNGFKRWQKDVKQAVIDTRAGRTKEELSQRSHAMLTAMARKQ